MIRFFFSSLYAKQHKHITKPKNKWRNENKSKRENHKMMQLKDFYNVLSSVLPLYFTMVLAYGAVRWWHIFSGDHCYAINRFFTVFTLPFITIKCISSVNLHQLNYPFLFADSISKVFLLLLPLSWAKFLPWGSLDWATTFFSVAAFPNTLIFGLPMITSMYGDEQQVAMVELVVMQAMVWNTVLMILLEIRAARNDLIGMLNLSSGEPPVAGDRAGDGEDNPVVVQIAPVDLPSPQGTLDQAVKFHEEPNKEEGEKEGEKEKLRMSWSTIRLIMVKVLQKVLRNPNSYAPLVGLIWVVVSSRWGIKQPVIIKNSISILADAAPPLAMFSLGMFMAIQPRIISCGVKETIFSLFVRFIVGPLVVGLAALAVGIKGKILKVIIVQAALPQGVVQFVFAREYHLHPEVLSMLVSFGMIVAFPIIIIYYIIFEHIIK